MVGIKLPYIVCQRSKGREYFYFRRDGQYIKLPHPIAENVKFRAKYERLLKSADVLPTEAALPGSFGALVEGYLASSMFKSISPRSQYEYRRQIDPMKKEWGDLPVSRLTRRGVMAYKATLSETPRMAHMAMQVLRRLLNYAIDIGIISVNPALRPGKHTAEQFKPWPDAAVTAFREKNADDAMMLLALDLGLYTGQRRGDVIGMAWRDYDGRSIAVIQGKTGERAWIPVHAALKARLDAMRGALMPACHMLTSPMGKRFTPTHFGHVFHDAVATAALGDDGLSFHGLRVTAAMKMAEAGCTDSEIQAVLGHRTVAMAAYYRRQSDKQVHAEAAILKLERKMIKV